VVLDLGVRITLHRALNCIHRNFQRHRAVSLRQHSFLALICSLYDVVHDLDINASFKQEVSEKLPQG